MDKSIQLIQPENVAKPGGHYSHAVTANGFVFISGQLPITSHGIKLSDASFDTQAAQCLANVKAARAAAGSGIDKLAQVRVYLDSIDNWPAFNIIYAVWAGDARPARAIILTPELHFGLKIEIEAIAVV